MKMKKKKMITGYFKVRSFARETCSWPSRLVYRMAVLYLTLNCLAICSLFRNFPCIQMYRENESTGCIPTYRFTYINIREYGRTLYVGMVPAVSLSLYICIGVKI